MATEYKVLHNIQSSATLYNVKMGRDTCQSRRPINGSRLRSVLIPIPCGLWNNK
jgi:hypothetical protein